MTATPFRVRTAEGAAELPDQIDPPAYDLSYRDRFWQGRDYEDRADRIAIRALLPPTGGDLLDLGAGFGRLAGEFSGYDRLTLVDASALMLAAAAERLGEDPRVSLVQASAHCLPFADASFDTIAAIRLIVHVRNPEALFAEIHRVLRPGGTLILEFPNRRHILAVARHLAGRQSWCPNGRAPHEYLADHFAHQPAVVRGQLRRAGLPVEIDPCRIAAPFDLAQARRRH